MFGDSNCLGNGEGFVSVVMLESPSFLVRINEIFVWLPVGVSMLVPDPSGVWCKSLSRTFFSAFWCIVIAWRLSTSFLL